MLRIENLDVFHGDAQALDGVSLEIEEGAIVAIVGANGAGKTSLIRTVGGMHRPARGRILYRGADIAGWQSHKVCAPCHAKLNGSEAPMALEALKPGEINCPFCHANVVPEKKAKGDMVTAVLMEGSRETIRSKMEMLGRFLGFSRLLDAAMVDDDMPTRVAQAFLAGDYALEGLAGTQSE